MHFCMHFLHAIFPTTEWKMGGKGSESQFGRLWTLDIFRQRSEFYRVARGGFKGRGFPNIP